MAGPATNTTSKDDGKGTNSGTKPITTTPSRIIAWGSTTGKLYLDDGEGADDTTLRLGMGEGVGGKDDGRSDGQNQDAERLDHDEK